MYEARFADLYDLVQEGRGKDYATESALVTETIRERCPDARSVLDIACGTGGHLRFLREEFAEAEGLEIEPDMLAIARRRLPGLRIRQGDMRDFQLDRTFDAVVIMFGSIGYVADKDELDRTVDCLARHLSPGGVLVIEPWVFPDTFAEGYVAADTIRDGKRSIMRMSHSMRDGDAVCMTVHYLCGDPEEIQHLTDTHRLSLFTRAQYEETLTRAGCAVEFLQADGFSRGLFVGVRR